MPRPRVLTDEQRLERRKESRKKHERKRNDLHISLRIDEELLQLFDSKVNFQGTTRRKVLLKLINDYLENNNQ